MNRVRTLCALIITLLAFTLAACDPSPKPALEFEHARVRLPLPGTDKTVGYFVVRNHTQADITLQSVHAAGVRTIEFHRTTVVDGVSRMRRLQDVVVEGGSQLAFEPGGRHLMLFGVTLEESDPVLVFVTSAGDIAVPFARISLTE